MIIIFWLIYKKDLQIRIDIHRQKYTCIFTEIFYILHAVFDVERGYALFCNGTETSIQHSIILDMLSKLVIRNS